MLVRVILVIALVVFNLCLVFNFLTNLPKPVISKKDESLLESIRKEFVSDGLWDEWKKGQEPPTNVVKLEPVYAPYKAIVPYYEHKDYSEPTKLI